MPNWCDNYIIIYGEKENMAPIYKYFTESERVIQEVNKVRRDILASGTPLDDVLRDYPYPDNFVMESLYPRDEEYDRIVKEHDYLLSPQSTFYGTKWDFRFEEVNLHSITEQEIIIAPMTAWDPCDRFCKKLSKKYGIDVSIQYDEPGNAIVGRVEYDNGEIIEEERYDGSVGTSDDYLRGQYKLDRELFWSRLESTIETYVDRKPDAGAIQFIEEIIPFINEEVVMEVEQLYNQIKQDAAK
jgi:hypothetical protein